MILVRKEACWDHVLQNCTRLCTHVWDRTTVFLPLLLLLAIFSYQAHVCRRTRSTCTLHHPTLEKRSFTHKIDICVVALNMFWLILLNSHTTFAVGYHIIVNVLPCMISSFSPETMVQIPGVSSGENQPVAHLQKTMGHFAVGICPRLDNEPNRYKIR